MDLAKLTADTFAPHIGEQFRVDPGAEPAFDLTLVEVSEDTQQGAPRRPFCVVFRGGPQLPQPQRVYRLEHDALGPLEIFLVPIGPDAQGQRYEAVFS